MAISATLRLGLVAILAFAAFDARALTLLSDDRYVRYYHDFLFDGQPAEDITVTPATPFGPMSENAQTSSMQLSHGVPGVGDVLDGTVFGYAFSNFAFDETTFWQSVFSIRFRVDGSAAQFALSGDMNGESVNVSSFVRLTGASGTVYEFTVPYDILCQCQPVPTGFSGTGSLAPGEYELQAVPSGFRNPTLNLTFSVTDNVPEPTTAMLLGTGLVGMLRFGRSRRSKT